MSCVGDIGGRLSYRLKDGYERDGMYPYEVSYPDPDTGEHIPGYLVLGPDVMASRDGDLIVWRRVTYVRQVPIPVPDPLEESNGTEQNDILWRNGNGHHIDHGFID